MRRFFAPLAGAFSAIALTTVLTSCAGAPAQREKTPEDRYNEEAMKAEGPASPAPEEKTGRAEFAPASEDLSPLKTRTISVSARKAPLRDILYTIADSAFLNVVMEKGVDPDTPVSITIKNMRAGEVLDTVLSSVDYFYTVDENILTVKLMDTRVYEFGTPSVIQDYSVTVGGDMLGGAKTSNSGVTGNITQKVESDKESFKFWESVEKSVAGLLSIRSNAPAGAQGALPSFSINRMTGTVVVTAGKKDLARVEGYLALLKKILRRQVLVEARIVEVQLTDALKYGIDWSFLGKGWNAVGKASGGTTGFTGPLTGLPNFNVTLAASDFTALLKALKQQGDINVLSNPRVSIMNGQTAFLSVGRKVDFISKVETTSTGSTTSVPTVTFTVETSSVLSGIVFGIVPYISGAEEKNISMTISPIVTDLVKLDNKVVGTTGSNSVELSLPTVDLRELSTTVRVANGQMVIIGGLIQKKDKVQENRVPLLADIPLIGFLFKNLDKTSEKTELIIMLKPLIVPEAA